MDPTLAIQIAIVAAMKAHGPLAALIGTKVYGRVPAGPPPAVPPYVHMSGWQEINDDTDCSDASEVFFDIQAFSTTVGRPQVANIAAAVKGALNRLQPTVTGSTNVEILHTSTQYFTDDGLTSRAVVSFRALVDSA